MKVTPDISVCPSPDVLDAFVAGALDASTRNSIQSHLASCTDCVSQCESRRNESNATVSHHSDALALNTPTGALATAIPEKISKYFVLRTLGQGSFGVVYKAKAPEDNRLVAIKVPSSRHLTSASQVAAFLKEARLVGELHHEKIVQVFDWGRTADNGCYVVMEFIDGKTLYAEKQSAKLSWRRAAEIAADVADALQFAHVHGIIHRDVKPANILIDSMGRTRLTDFGLALSEEERSHKRRSWAGTPSYMSPEQISGETLLLDHRTDIWSLGVVLYEMLTSSKPFAGESTEELAEAIQRTAAKPLSLIDDEIPQELGDACLRCLANNPADRWSTAAELASALRNWLGTNEIRKDRRWVMLSALVGIPSLVAGGTWLGTAWNSNSTGAGEAAEDTNTSREQDISNPVKVAWNPYDIHDSHGFDEASQEYRFDAFGHALFAVKEVNSAATELRVRFTVKRWNGWVGAFWRLHSLPDGTLHCWAILAGRGGTDEPYQVEICEFTIGVLGGGRQGVKAEIVHWFADAPLPLDEATLQFRASADRVESIQLNGLSVLPQPWILSQKHPARDRGRIGFCGQLGVVSVRELTEL